MNENIHFDSVEKSEPWGFDQFLQIRNLWIEKIKAALEGVDEYNTQLTTEGLAKLAERTKTIEEANAIGETEREAMKQILEEYEEWFNYVKDSKTLVRAK